MQPPGEPALRLTVALLGPCCETCGECQDDDDLPTGTAVGPQCLRVPPSQITVVVVLSVEEVIQRSVLDWTHLGGCEGQPWCSRRLENMKKLGKKQAKFLQFLL